MAQSLFEECQQKKNDIAEMGQQAKQMDAEIANVDLKIRDLERQRQQLVRDKFEKAHEKAKLQNRIRLDQKMMDRMCSGLRQCDNLEQRVDALKARLAPLAEQLRRIRREIAERNADTVRLNREVNKIETSYRQLNCDNLVAGQAQQTTIDRCTDLFSRWNQSQKDINGLRASVAALRGRYRKVMQKMRIHGVNLARLLAKMRRTLNKALPGAPHEVWLTVDASTGTNALVQAREFGKIFALTGLVLTKLDGTGKGGVVVAIRKELGLPVHYVGLGEAMTDLQPFDPQMFARALFE